MYRVIMLLVLSFNVMAMGTAFESSGATVQLSETEAQARFNVAEPVCLKDGARVLSYNDAYKAKYKGDKVPCRKKFVTIIKLKDLQVNVQKKILGIN